MGAGEAFPIFLRWKMVRSVEEKCFASVDVEVLEGVEGAGEMGGGVVEGEGGEVLEEDDSAGGGADLGIGHGEKLGRVFDRRYGVRRWRRRWR